MLAQEVQKHNINSSVLFQDPLNEKLLQVLSVFAQTLKMYGYKMEVSTGSTLLKLQQVPEEKKLQIISAFENWNTWITPQNSNITEIDTYSEKDFIAKALAHYNCYVDEAFWKTVEGNQVVEIYGPDMTQMYRSMNFFEFTSYSLLDLVVNEWYVLWERPKLIIEKMMAAAGEALTGSLPIKKFDVPKHLLREVLNTTGAEPFVPSATIIEFVNIGAVRSLSNHEIMGFFCTCRGEKIAEGQEALNIAFV